MYYKVFNSKTCFPEPVALTGTFTSLGTTITTNVVSGLKVGDYLYCTTTNELRNVLSITNPIVFTLDSAFSSDVTDEVIKISDSTIVYTKATVFNFANTSGLFNGYEFPRQSIIEIGNGPIRFTISGIETKISILAT